MLKHCRARESYSRQVTGKRGEDHQETEPSVPCARGRHRRLCSHDGCILSLVYGFPPLPERRRGADCLPRWRLAGAQLGQSRQLL